MDYKNAEVLAVGEATKGTTEVVDLTELELALVGGGSGEVSPY